MPDLAATVAAFLAEHGVSGPIVVGVSGGPDSTALLHALVGAGGDPHGAHLHHGLRGEDADADAAFVEDLATRLGVGLTVRHADVAAEHATRRGGSLADTARRARRRLFAEVAGEIGASWIAVAHTADDQAETVLLNLLRGSGLRGLGGMRPVHGRIIRPLLAVRRQDVLDHLDASGLEYRTDASNLDLDRPRNRIRHELLPHLAERYNPQVVEALNRTASLAADAADWTDAEVAELLGGAARRAGGTIEVDAAALRDAPRHLALAALRAVVVELAGGALDVTLEHAEAAAALLDGTAPAVTLPGEVIARRAGGRIRLDRKAPAQQRWEVAAALPGTTPLPEAGLRVVLEEAKVPDRPRTGPDEAYLDADRVTPPLVIRNRRPGDRFHPLGAPGSQKLKQFLSDRKVPAAQRDRVPLLVDADGIVCVVGHRIADRAKLGPSTTRCLHVEVLRDE